MISIETITITSGFYKENLYKVILDLFPFKQQERETSSFIEESEELSVRYFEIDPNKKKFRMIVFLNESEKKDLIEDLNEKNITKIFVKYQTNNKTLKFLYDCLIKDYDISRSIILWQSEN